MIRKQILILALPAVAEMMINTLVGVIIVAIVGRLGANSISTVGINNLIIINAAFVLSAVGVGASVLVARAVGKKDLEKANYFLAKGLALGIIVSVCWGGLFYLAVPRIVDLLHLGPVLAVMLTRYLHIIALPSAALVLLFVLEFMVRGAGHTLVTFSVAALSGILNILVSYALAYGKFGFPKYQVEGAAYGASISYIAALLVMLAILASGKLRVKINWRELVKADKITYKRILNTGVPTGLEEGMWALNQWVLLGILPSLGSIQYAAHQIASSVEGISFMPGYGFAIASQVLVGQRLGVDDIKEVKKIPIEALKLALTVMTGVTLVFFFGNMILVRFFTDKPELLPWAAACIRIAAFEQPTLAVYMVLSGSFRGAGDTRWPLYLLTIIYWAYRVPMVWLAIKVWHLNITSFWYITAIQWLIVALACFYHYRGKKWYTREV